jgi:hypothetical protein
MTIARNARAVPRPVVAALLFTLHRSLTERLGLFRSHGDT